jgi:hypothetical protein
MYGIIISSIGPNEWPSSKTITEIVYACCGNTAVDVDPLPVSHVRLTVVELALFECDVFEMAAPIQSPAKCEVHSVIQFLNARGEQAA